jgi:hypothetical protein
MHDEMPIVVLSELGSPDPCLKAVAEFHDLARFGLPQRIFSRKSSRDHITLATTQPQP